MTLIVETRILGFIPVHQSPLDKSTLKATYLADPDEKKDRRSASVTLTDAGLLQLTPAGEGLNPTSNLSGDHLNDAEIRIQSKWSPLIISVIKDKPFRC